MAESPIKSLLILLAIALVCSVLVSMSAIGLRPIQLQNELIERYRNIVALTGLAPAGQALSDEEILSVVTQLDLRVVNLETGRFEADLDPENINSRRAANDPTASTEIPADADLARIGRRAHHEVVYLVWRDEGLSRIILPIHGQGMWSTLYGLIGLEADLNTVAAITFYEQTETAGLGDQIQRPEWQALWQGRQLFGGDDNVRFRVAIGVVEPGAPGSEYEVDGLSGATVTGSGVTNLVRFWFGAEGYGPLLAEIRDSPPVQMVTSRARLVPSLLDAVGD